MSRNLFATIVLAGTLCSVAQTGLAGQDLAAKLQACREEPNAAQRLACYDHEVDQLGKEALASYTAPAVAPDPEARFGYQGAIAYKEMERIKEEARGIDKLVATVTEISMQPRGEHIITLDNEQVWIQKRPDPNFRLKVGDEVNITPASLGSFLMSSPSKRSTRVVRVR